MVVFEEILDDMIANGYTILEIQIPESSPDMRIVKALDSAGSLVEKKYLIVIKYDENNNTLIEDCQEIA